MILRGLAALVLAAGASFGSFLAGRATAPTHPTPTGIGSAVSHFPTCPHPYLKAGGPCLGKR